ncbi:MAG: DUF4388 domain-containing protein [Acidimicrobiales bacterium]
MSLEGSLETISLPDVLALLSVTAKTGELQVESRGTAGSIWFNAGQLVGFDVGGQKTPVDALFRLLRYREGHFSFRTGTAPANEVAPQDVAPMLEEAENWLAEWPAIEAVVPSLDAVVSLQGSVEEPVTLLPEEWRLVAAIGSGRAVRDVLAALGLGEFAGRKALKKLVELHLAEVATPGAEHASESAPATVVPAFVPESAWQQGDEVADLSEVWDDDLGGVRSEPEEPGQPEEPEVVPEPEPVNRGLLLKFLGSARN